MLVPEAIMTEAQADHRNQTVRLGGRRSWCDHDELALRAFAGFLARGRQRIGEPEFDERLTADSDPFGFAVDCVK